MERDKIPCLYEAMVGLYLRYPSSAFRGGKAHIQAQRLGPAVWRTWRQILKPPGVRAERGKQYSNGLV